MQLYVILVLADMKTNSVPLFKMAQRFFLTLAAEKTSQRDPGQQDISRFWVAILQGVDFCHEVFWKHVGIWTEICITKLLFDTFHFLKTSNFAFIVLLYGQHDDVLQKSDLSWKNYGVSKFQFKFFKVCQNLFQNKMQHVKSEKRFHLFCCWVPI